jgi:endonuclease/exonuclease/phosphatase family metal-dependent hydrolase
MVTWGRLRQTAGSDILILNTHLPYGRGADEARRQSALVLLQTIAKLPLDLPLFLTGDFNAPVGGEVYAQLTETLADAWITASERVGPEGTFHGFGRFKGTRRLDWILHRNAGRTLTAETITNTANGQYPSDHYPVCATFLLDPCNPAAAH